jgi:hypothetical protein
VKYISMPAIIAIHQRSFRNTTRTGKLEFYYKDQKTASKDLYIISLYGSLCKRTKTRADSENYGYNVPDDDIFRTGEESEINQTLKEKRIGSCALSRACETLRILY